MLIPLLCAAVAIALLFPETPAGRFLGRRLIEAPLRRLTPARIVIGLLIGGAIAVAVALVKSDGMIMVAQALPEGLAWLAAFDMTSFIDVIVLAWLVAASLRFRGAFKAAWSLAARAGGRLAGLAAGLGQRRRLGAQSRAHRTRRARSSPDGPDGEGRLIWPVRTGLPAPGPMIATA